MDRRVDFLLGREKEGTEERKEVKREREENPMSVC